MRTEAVLRPWISPSLGNRICVLQSARKFSKAEDALSRAIAAELANAAADFNFGLLIAETDPKVRPCRNYARAWKWTRQIRRRRITWLAGRHDEPGGSAGTVPKSSGPGSGNPKYQLAVAYYAARRK